MSDKSSVSRRTALKSIAVGVSIAGAQHLLDHEVSAQDGHAGMAMGGTVRAPAPAAEKLRYFNAHEIATISAVSDLIIPADNHSPGAAAVGVAGFIDLMVSESPDEVKQSWRKGLAAVDEMSRLKYGSAFVSVDKPQQIALLTDISRNERSPRSVAEQFFVTIKGMTVDGYYTSSAGIHQDLQYKGNAYLKEFIGCTHPEHMG